jgi:hypothetical protein
VSLANKSGANKSLSLKRKEHKMFTYNSKISRTANAKAMVGLTMKITPSQKWASPKVGKVVKVVGLNGECAKVIFENGEYTYYTWSTKAQSV